MSWINRESQNGNSNRESDYPFARRVSWLFLISSILLLIYIYYRAEIIFEGALAEKYFKYYPIILAGVFFWGVVLRLREEIQAKIVTVAISLVVGLYLIESGLTFFGKGHFAHRTGISTSSIAAAAELGIDYDQRTKMEVIEDLIAEGVDAVPAVRPRDIDGQIMDVNFFSLGGISNKTTVGENESGRRMIYLSDRYGFNNPDFEWDFKEVEWLLTGDSFTEGVAIQPGEDIASKLRVITQKSAINLGRSGNGPLIELATLTEYARTIKPKKVLWMYFMNDLIYELKREKNNSLLMQYMEDGFSQNLLSRQEEIDRRLEKYISEAKVQNKTQVQEQAQSQSEALARWMKLTEVRFVLGFDQPDIDIDDPLFAKILTKAKARVESWGGTLYFIYLPEYSRYKNKLTSHNQYRKKSEVIDLINRLDIPVIDIHQEVFSNNPDPLSLFPFRLPGHYNADGYNEVAKAIVTSVDKYEQSTK